MSSNCINSFVTQTQLMVMFVPSQHTFHASLAWLLIWAVVIEYVCDTVALRSCIVNDFNWKFVFGCWQWQWNLWWEHIGWTVLHFPSNIIYRNAISARIWNVFQNISNTWNPNRRLFRSFDISRSPQRVERVERAINLNKGTLHHIVRSSFRIYCVRNMVSIVLNYHVPL